MLEANGVMVDCATAVCGTGEPGPETHAIPPLLRLNQPLGCLNETGGMGLWPVFA